MYDVKLYATLRSRDRRLLFIVRVTEDGIYKESRTVIVGEKMEPRKAYGESIGHFEELCRQYHLILVPPTFEQLLEDRRGKSRPSKTMPSIQIKSKQSRTRQIEASQREAEQELALTKLDDADLFALINNPDKDELLNGYVEFGRRIEMMRQNKDRIIREQNAVNAKIALIIIEARQNGVSMPTTVEIEALIEHIMKERLAIEASATKEELGGTNAVG